MVESITMASTAATAPEKVLLLPELLEDIISYLPMKNVHGIRRVCKTWDNVIATSEYLKPKMTMFLDPDDGDTGDDAINPVLRDMMTILLKAEADASYSVPRG
jgi:hypothetical protein